MSQVPATQADEKYSATGLDDFGVTDAVLPRIRIDHEKAVWRDNLTNADIPNLRFIVLGLVKQRVLFHANVETDDVPMCRSSDFVSGFPNPDAPRDKSFPWDKSGFNPNDFPPDANGNIQLPCEGCHLKDWGSHPMGNTPYCSEQWTMPIYYDSSEGGVGEWQPAILTLQKSSIKPIRSYLTAFKSANKAPFQNVCNGTLRQQSRGSVNYAVPVFTKGEESPRDRWAEFNDQYFEMREYLTRPPVREADAPVTPTSNVNTGPQPQQPVAPSGDPWGQQAVQPPPQQGDPWAVPQQQAPAPAQAAPPQQAPVAPPAQPVAPPAPAPAPVQQAPAPVAPPAQPEVEQGPPQTPPPAGQGLPF